MTDDRQPLEKIGALWAYTSRQGREYWRGMVRIRGGGDVQVMMFRNRDKQGDDGRPEFVILREPLPDLDYLPDDEEADETYVHPF